jgi:hypothetical protein
MASSPLSGRDAAAYFEAVIAAVLSTSWGQLGPQSKEAAIQRYKETLQALRDTGDAFN